MLLFKYFEKGAKDGLPDPNGPLSSRAPSYDNISHAIERYLGGKLAEYLLSQQLLKERKVVYTIIGK